jgi:glucan phosphoethanolaminetransferase (alkaline phosphatase superfamily)
MYRKILAFLVCAFILSPFVAFSFAFLTGFFVPSLHAKLMTNPGNPTASWESLQMIFWVYFAILLLLCIYYVFIRKNPDGSDTEA